MNIQRGFTLIELMIVVAIIAILAAIAISQYQDYVIRSQVSEGASLSASAKVAVAEFVNNYGRYPNANPWDNTSLGLPGIASITGTYVGQLIVQDGEIYARFSSDPPHKANPVLSAKYLQFSPITHAGSIEWVCKAPTLKSKWVPASCH